MLWIYSNCIREIIHNRKLFISSWGKEIWLATCKSKCSLRSKLIEIVPGFLGKLRFEYPVIHHWSIYGLHLNLWEWWFEQEIFWSWFILIFWGYSWNNSIWSKWSILLFIFNSMMWWYGYSFVVFNSLKTLLCLHCLREYPFIIFRKANQFFVF